MSRLGRSQPKFDEAELLAFNTRFVRSMPYAFIRERISAGEDFWNAVRGNLNRVSDITEWEDICHRPLEPVIEDRELTALAAELLPPEPWNDDTFTLWMNEVKAQSGKKDANFSTRFAKP